MADEKGPSPKNVQNAERLARYRRGQRAEWFAAVALTLKGYRILALRYRTPVGEIDLVAKRGRRLAIVEVKRRNTLDEALMAITPKLQQRVQAAAELWLRRQGANFSGDLSFDVVALIPRRWPVHLRDAFDHRTRDRPTGF